LEAAAYATGATEASFHVDLLAAWPQLTMYYVVVALLPPTILLFLWRRARRQAALSEAT
jgi:hypothetical protein